MNDRPKALAKARRDRRLGAALRENLKRRKAQARGRRSEPAPDEVQPSHDCAVIGEDKRDG